MKITKQTTLAKILKIPGAEHILAKFNLPCLWCPMMKHEMGKLKLGQICETYNIDIKKLVKELNESRT